MTTLDKNGGGLNQRDNWCGPIISSPIERGIGGGSRCKDIEVMLEGLR